MDGGESIRLLFDPSELDLRPTGTARLRELARLPPSRSTPRERRREEDRLAIERLAGWGAALAREFQLSYAVIEAERDGVNEHYGVCYDDGVIRIRLRHSTTGKLLKESSLVNTLCHELAHLRHMNHKLGFRRLYRRILERAREAGYYRPGATRPSGPLQGELFGSRGCSASRGRT